MIFLNFSEPVENPDLFVRNFSLGLSKLSSWMVRGTFWSRIAFSSKNHHFQTLSKSLSTFCQNQFGRIVITAIYITSGAFIWKELLSKNLCFFIILHPWEGILWTSVVQISAWISKLHFSLLKGQPEVGNSIFLKNFPITVTQWVKKFIFLEEFFGMAAKVPFYVSVQSFWEKHTRWKIYIGLTFFGLFGEQVSTPCQKFSGQVIKNFSCTFFVFVYWAKKFLLFSKNSSEIYSKLLSTCPEDNLKQIFWFEIKFSSFSDHQLKTFLLNSFGWKFQN